MDGDAAWRNTVGMLQRNFDKEAGAYLAKGVFGTIALSGKPVDPRRIRGEELEPEEVRVLLADLAGTSKPRGAPPLARPHPTGANLSDVLALFDNLAPTSN